jgi:DNA-binding transcriptional regulator of glucitol operon
MSIDQIALLIGVIAAAPLLGWIVWKAIQHGSGGNT